MENFEKMIERMMQSLGDRAVLSIKVVENQIDNVESGGIGIQNNHYHGAQPPHSGGNQPACGNGPCTPDGNGQNPFSGAGQPQITAAVDQALAKAEQVREESDRQQASEGNEAVPSDEDAEFEVPSHIPSVLNTEKAWELWKRAKANGWVDRHLMPTLSENKATILANEMARLLALEHCWIPFEEFWGIKNMATKRIRAQENNYYPDLYQEIKTKLSS